MSTNYEQLSQKYYVFGIRKKHQIIYNDILRQLYLLGFLNNKLSIHNSAIKK